MNPVVADPHWGWWIVWYFFLGGIAAGAYFTAALIEWRGQASDRHLSRIGYLAAFPLVLLCGLFLTLDLEKPERFWHMLLQSEVVHRALEEGWPWTGAGWSWMVQAPLLKYWSPMSIGAWALLLFGLGSFLSFLGSFRRGGTPGTLWQRWRALGHLVSSGLGFFIASYTGVLLTATNHPLWSQSEWVAPLFLTSAASTGLATMALLAALVPRLRGEALANLERTEAWTIALELVVFLLFLASLRPFMTELWSLGPGKLLVLGPLVLGVLLPLALRLVKTFSWHSPGAAISVLLGGFLLRYAILMIPAELTARPVASVVSRPAEKEWFSISPEDGRQRGGGPGASDCNRARPLQLRSKITGDIMP